MDIARRVYRVTESFPKYEIYGLRSQIRRSAVSVPSNIAEGHGRLSDNSFRVFLAQARGSLFELQTQLELSADLDFISQQAASDLTGNCEEVARMLNGLIRTLETERASVKR